jgi:hypothetical protein
MTISLCHGAHGVRCFLNRGHNPILSATAAHVSLEFAFDFGLRRRWIPTEKSNALHDHARCAVTALHGIAIDECLLERMEAFAIRQAFDCRDLFTSDGSNRRKARAVRYPVDQDRTSTTLALAAPVLGTRQIEVVPKHPEQRSLRIGLDARAHTVHNEIHGFILDPGKAVWENAANNGLT